VLWVIFKKFEKEKQLYFGRFDEGFHGFTRTTLHFAIDPREPNFKTWVVCCLKNGLETLVRHIDMHLFRFFVDSLGWPIM
jgi:hypothetical protein